MKQTKKQAIIFLLSSNRKARYIFKSLAKTSVFYDTAAVWLSFSVTLLFCDTYSSVTQTYIIRKPKLHEGTILRNFQATTPANVFG